MRVKNGDELKLAIIDAATHLFGQRSVKDISIDEIVKEAGIAKGTFYLYFSSKQALLSYLAEDWVSQMADTIDEIAATEDEKAIDLFIKAFKAMKEIENKQPYLHAALETDNNIALHEQINIVWVKQIGLALTPLIKRGCLEGDFNVEDALSTIQFILAGQAFILGNARFSWSQTEYQTHFIATLKLTEKALGIKENTLFQVFTAF